MIQENIAFIANYLWKRSIDNIEKTLSDSQAASFNIKDYYYLTIIYGLRRPTLSELASELKLTKPAISAMVKRLIKDELILKLQSEEDKRVFHIELTSKALRIIEGDNKLYAELSEILRSRLSGDEIKKVDKLLTDVVNILKA